MKKNIGFIVLGILLTAVIVTVSLIIYEYQRIHYTTLSLNMEEYLLIGEETEVQYDYIVKWYNDEDYYIRNQTGIDSDSVPLVTASNGAELTIEKFKEQYTLSTDNDNITTKDDKIIANKAGETKLIFTQNKKYLTKDYEGKKHCYRIEVSAVMVYDPESLDFIKINNAEDFMNISSLGTTKKYILNQDIDFKDVEYSPIEFEGILINPKGYVIKNINYTDKEDKVNALFMKSTPTIRTVILGLRFEDINVNINKDDRFTLFGQSIRYIRDLDIKNFNIHLNFDSENPKCLLFLTGEKHYVLKDIKADYQVQGVEDTQLTLSYGNSFTLYCNNLDINVNTNMNCTRRYNDLLGPINSTNNNYTKVNGNIIDREKK